jgi:hypothetical protein
MAVFGIMGAVVVQKSGRFKWALIVGSAISAVGGGLLYLIKEDSTYAKIAGFQVSNDPSITFYVFLGAYQGDGVCS